MVGLQGHRQGNGRRRGSTGRGQNSTSRNARSRRISLRIRRVRPADLASIIALDKRVTGIAKARYWQDVFDGYGRRRSRERFFLTAEPLETKTMPKLLGFIVGEVRAWEFGSVPCGWIFALSVEPNARLHGIGEALFNAVAAEFAKAGVSKVRTMVARDNTLPMLFFRSQGMVAGPYIQLEKELGSSGS
jgi:ribosomal protein S18 acetylase RimI-like enzyme